MARSASVIYRPATAQDAQTAAEIIKAALDDLAAKQGRPSGVPAGAPEAPVLRHVLESCPDRFWIAEAAGAVIGFGAGLRRGHVCYLASLFVMPRWQGKGVGRELAQRAMAVPSGARDWLPVVGSSGANVVSNGLYASLDMLPLLPTVSLAGVVPDAMRRSLGSLLAATITVDDLDEVRAVDAFVTDIDRTADHYWLIAEVARRGWVFRRWGRVAGYAYLGGDGTSGPDHIGPVAALRRADVAPMLAFALVEHGVGRVAGVEVPGPNLASQRLLWGAGFRMAGPVGLLGAARPFGRFDRYLMAGNALM